MDRRRGNPTWWLLAAGALALAGCRTETGSEESSSWFDFSSRRGGHGGSSGAKPAAQPRPAAPAPTKGDTTTAPDPANATGPAPSKPARPANPPASSDAPIEAVRPTPLPAPAKLTDGSPRAAREAATRLGLKSSPGDDATRPAKPPLGLDVPDARPRSRATAPALALEPGSASKPARSEAGLPLPTTSTSSGRRPPAASLRLPGFGEKETTPGGQPALPLPEFDGPANPRDSRASLHLPSGDSPSGQDGRSPRIPTPSGEAPSVDSRLGRSLPIDGIRPNPSMTRPRASGLALPSPDAAALQAGGGATVGLPVPADKDSSRARANTGSLPVGLTGEAPAARAAATGLRGLAGETAARSNQPSAEARDLPPFASGTNAPTIAGRGLHAPAPEAQPAQATIPLPFRLSLWISDEETHRRWRAQQLDRAGAEEKARQAEQERLRQALLRFLLPDAPAK